MPTGLIRRGGRYSTRRVIPQDLQGYFHKREIVRALGTSDPKEAKLLHARMWVRLDEEFASARRLAIQSSAPLALRPARPGLPWQEKGMSDGELEQMEWNADEAC